MKHTSSHPTVRLKKSLGQHFLKNTGILRRIVSIAGLSPEDTAIEIGTGDGRLTRLLAAAAGKVISFEIDERFRAVHEKTLGNCDNVEIVYDDILKVDLNNLVATRSLDKITIVGNIPYNITAPLIMKLLKSGIEYEGLYFMLQKELAERITASPGTKAYGVFGIKVTCFCEPAIQFIVSRTQFVPSPKVDSAFVSFVPRSKFPFDTGDERESFFRFIERIFAHRRKTLINSLCPRDKKRDLREHLQSILETTGATAQIRAEALPIETLIELFRKINAHARLRSALGM